MANETKLIPAVELFAFDNATVRAEKRAAAKANAFVDGGSFQRRQMRVCIRVLSSLWQWYTARVICLPPTAIGESVRDETRNGRSLDEKRRTMR